MSDLIYLAQPYSHPDPAVREARFHAGCRAAAHLMGQGMLVFAPIPHTHPIACAGELPKGWDFWERFDRAILGACGRVIVLTLPGWRESVGVTAELDIAAEGRKVVAYMEPETWELTDEPPDDSAREYRGEFEGQLSREGR